MTTKFWPSQQNIMNTQDSLDPEFLAALDEERNVVSSFGHNVRRLRIDRGCSVTVRFLPVKLGSKGLFYARIYNHWIGKRPYFCAEKTSVDFGGTGEPCAICRETTKLNESKDRNMSSVGFKSGANPQWVTFCLVYERENASGDIVKVRGDELWKAWEFPLARNTFDDLLSMYRRGLKSRSGKINPDSIFDLYDGCDIIVRAKQRDIALEKLDPQPIMSTADPEKFQAVVNAIWSTITPPHFRALSDNECDMAIEKLHDSLRAARRRGEYEDERSPRRGDYDDADDRRGGRRANNGDEDDDRVHSRGSRRDDDGDEDDRGRRHDDEPEDPRRDAPRERQSEEAPRRLTPPPARKITESSPPPPTRTSTPPPTQSTLPPPTKALLPPPTKPSLSPPPARRTTTEPPASSRPIESSIEESDNVADESRDPAPPSSELTGLSEADEPPPTITQPPPGKAANEPVADAASEALKRRLTRGIAAAKERL
jgi:hypothetical protein